MKLWRRVGKRADEILEDDLLAPVEDDIDIVGGVVKDEDQDTAVRPKVRASNEPSRRSKFYNHQTLFKHNE